MISPQVIRRTEMALGGNTGCPMALDERFRKRFTALWAQNIVAYPAVAQSICRRLATGWQPGMTICAGDGAGDLALDLAGLPALSKTVLFEENAKRIDSLKAQVAADYADLPLEIRHASMLAGTPHTERVDDVIDADTGRTCRFIMLTVEEDDPAAILGASDVIRRARPLMLIDTGVADVDPSETWPGELAELVQSLGLKGLDGWGEPIGKAAGPVAARYLWAFDPEIDNTIQPLLPAALRKAVADATAAIVPIK
ncbi:MAG: hypothetical protein AAFR41_09745 [Pseudomonadota bacterium]